MHRYKKFLVVCLSVVIIILIIFIQNREVTVHDSFSETGTNQYTEEITIIANRLIIWDTEEFAEEIIQKCIENSFKEIRFSYDLRGYPTELRIHVYTNKLLWHNHVESFEIIYAQDSSNNPPYNIKDNPEKFEMKIIKN